MANRSATVGQGWSVARGTHCATPLSCTSSTVILRLLRPFYATVLAYTSSTVCAPSTVALIRIYGLLSASSRLPPPLWHRPCLIPLAACCLTGATGLEVTRKVTNTPTGLRSPAAGGRESDSGAGPGVLCSILQLATDEGYVQTMRKLTRSFVLHHLGRIVAEILVNQYSVKDRIDQLKIDVCCATYTFYCGFVSFISE